MNEPPTIIRSGQATVKIYSCKTRDSSVIYVLAWYVGRTRLRKGMKDQKAAFSEAKRIAKILGDGRDALTNVGLRDLEYYKGCEKKLNGVPLDRAVDFYLAQHNKTALSNITVAKLIEEFLAKHRVANRHRYTLNYHLNTFKKVFGDHVASTILAKDYDHYLDNSDWSLRTRHNHRASLIQISKYAQRKGYLPRGQATEAELSEEVRFPKTKKMIWTPQEMQKLLGAANYKTRPWIAIGAFSGIRPAEIERLTWEDFDWDNHVIRLESRVTKTQRDRLAVITPSLEAWLTPYRDLKGNVMHSVECFKPYLDLKHVCQKAGVPWKPNASRHSFASYYLIYTQDPGKTALASGHSVQMLLSVYMVVSVNGSTITQQMAKTWVEDIRPIPMASHSVISA